MFVRQITLAASLCLLSGCSPEDENAVRACASQGLEPCSRQLLAAANSGTGQDVYRWYLFNFMYTKGNDATLQEASKKESGTLNCAALAGYQPAVEHAEHRIAYFGSLVGAHPSLIQQTENCLTDKSKALFGGDDRWTQCSADKVLLACPVEFKKSAQ